MHLGFDVPGKIGFAIFSQDGIGADGVFVLGIDQEAVHVEQTGPNGRGPGEILRISCEREE